MLRGQRLLTCQIYHDTHDSANDLPWFGFSAGIKVDHDSCHRSKVIGPRKRAPRQCLDPSRLEYGRERHSALRGNAVARFHTNSTSLVHADVSGPIYLLYRTIEREQPSGT